MSDSKRLGAVKNTLGRCVVSVAIRGARHAAMAPRWSAPGIMEAEHIGTCHPKQRSSLTPTKHRVANEVEANANAA